MTKQPNPQTETVSQPSDSAEMVCVAVITGAHGVHGRVTIKSFTENPLDVTSYGVMTDKSGAKRFKVELTGKQTRGLFIAKLSEVRSRNDAEALRGVELFVPRTQMPDPEEEEFYYSDLEGLEAVLVTGEVLGRVAAVYDFGAGDMLEIPRQKAGSLMVPFTKDIVPQVDLANGRLVIDPPPGLLEAPEPEAHRSASPEGDAQGAAKPRSKKPVSDEPTDGEEE